MIKTIKVKHKSLLKLKVRMDAHNIDFDVPMVQGDTGPKLQFEIIDEYGDPVDLTGKQVGFVYKRVGDVSGLNPTSSGCVIESASGGIATYTFGGDALNRSGVYFGDIIVIDDLKTTQARAIRFNVRDNNQ